MYNNRKFCMLGNVWKSWGWLSGNGTWDNRMMVMHLITFGLVRVDIHVKQTKERETGPDSTVVYRVDSTNSNHPSLSDVS